MAYWTYSAKVDMTNGGADDQAAITVVSGLPSGVIEIEVLYTLVSTTANNQSLRLVFGDSGGFETAGYENAANNAATGENKTDGFYNNSNPSGDAPDEVSGVFRCFRWDASEHLWSVRHFGNEHGATSAPRTSSGYKTLSGELTQIQATTSLGVGLFDGGEIRSRYI